MARFSLIFTTFLSFFVQAEPEIKVEIGKWDFQERAGTFEVKPKGKILAHNVSQNVKVTKSDHLKLYQVINIPKDKDVCITLTYEKSPDEILYGAGTQYTHLSLNGRITEFLTQEQGNGRGVQPLTFFQSLFAPGLSGSDTTTYASSPMIITSKLRAYIFDSYAYGLVDVTNSKQFKVSFHTKELKVFHYQEKNWPKLFEQTTKHTGRMRELPNWIQNGAILGLMGGKQKVLETLKKLKNSQAAISAVWTQDWVGRRQTFLGPRLLWDWRLNKKEYPDMNFGATIASLGYFNPFLSALPKETRSPSFYDEALKKDFLVKAHGKVYTSKQGGFEGHLVDLFNPEAYQWLKNKMKAAITKHHFKGWMADFGEVLPFDAQTSAHVSKQHHQYVEQWIRLNRELVDELGPKDLTFFNRSSHLKIPGLSTLYWLGDQTSTWDKQDGLHSSVIGLLTSGLSGKTLNHSDIGGYVSFCLWPLICFKREQELLQRWMEVNAFTAIFRTHPGLKPSIAEQVYSSQASIKAFSYWSRVFKELKHYKRPYITLASQKGMPLIRPLFLNYPADKRTLMIDDQFMLGEELMIAPVLKPETNSREVYFPKGKWHHLWSDLVIQSIGATFNVQAPLGKPAIFYRPGFPQKILKNIQSLKY